MNDYEKLKSLIKEKAYIVDPHKKFRLASGEESNCFFDLKPVLLDPEGSALIARCIFEKIKNTSVKFVGGLEIGAIPITVALCQLSWQEKRPIYGFFVRKSKKERGTEKLIEGNLERNQKVIILDDVITKGNSVIQAIEAVKNQYNCTVERVISVIDRENPSGQFKGLDIKFEPLFKKTDFDVLEKNNPIANAC